MGLFDRFRKHREDAPEAAQPPQAAQTPQQEREEQEPAPAVTHSAAYLAAFSRSVAVARLRQLRFGAWIDKRDWNLDFAQGTIAFGEESFPLEFLGSQSDSSNTWLWGVDNLNNFPETILGAVRVFWESGLRASIPELAETKVPVDEMVNGHALASIVAAQAAEPVCYYRCPYEGGAAFVLVRELPQEVFAPPKGAEIVAAVGNMIGAMPLDHRSLAEGLLDAFCGEITREPGELRGLLPDGEALSFRFDEQDRLSGMNCTPRANEQEGDEGDA